MHRTVNDDTIQSGTLDFKACGLGTILTSHCYESFPLSYRSLKIRIKKHPNVQRLLKLSVMVRLNGAVILLNLEALMFYASFLVFVPCIRYDSIACITCRDTGSSEMFDISRANL